MFWYLSSKSKRIYYKISNQNQKESALFCYQKMKKLHKNQKHEESLNKWLRGDDSESKSDSSSNPIRFMKWLSEQMTKLESDKFSSWTVLFNQTTSNIILQNYNKDMCIKKGSRREELISHPLFNSNENRWNKK